MLRRGFAFLLGSFALLRSVGPVLVDVLIRPSQVSSLIPLHQLEVTENGNTYSWDGKWIYGNAWFDV